MSNIADVVLGVLKDASVKRIYGIPGDSLNGFTDALRRDGTIAWQHVRHEEAAALAAAAEASLTGELAVCVGSCGPGSIHLINGLYDANRSRVPVLAIAAQIPGPEMGSTYFQETRPQDVFRKPPFTASWSAFLSSCHGFLRLPCAPPLNVGALPWW